MEVKLKHLHLAPQRGPGASYDHVVTLQDTVIHEHAVLVSCSTNLVHEVTQLGAVTYGELRLMTTTVPAGKFPKEINK
jgi:hypothetical protein